MYDRWVDGDTKAAVDLHYALHPLVDLLFVETNPAPIKRVLAALRADRLRLRPAAADPGHRARQRRRSSELLVEGLPALDGPPAELARATRRIGTRAREQR